MANSKGWKGYFTFGGENFGSTINTFSTDESVGEVDVSAFDATSTDRSRNYEPGLKESTASVSGFADPDDTGQQYLKVSLNEGIKYHAYFFLEEGKYYGGHGFVTSRTIDHNFDDSVAEISVDLRIDGTLEEYNIS